MKTINTAYVALAPFVSGSERCLQLILSQCKQNGVSPILITPKASPLRQWAFDNDIEHYSVDLTPSPSGNYFSWLKQQLKLVWIFRKCRISVIHSNQIWSYPAIALPAKLFRIKTVCHLRDPITKGSLWWLKHHPNNIICISNYIHRKYSEIFHSVEGAQVDTIIDPVHHQPTLNPIELAEQKTQAKEALDVPPGTFTFGYIGQIAPVKGVLETIESLSALSDKNWRLLIAGKDPSETQNYIRECKNLVEKLGLEKQVRFLGFLDNTSTFYYACDTIVMLSRAEPLGLIPLEAAMHYTPAIVNAVGGLPETVIDGHTGWIVDVKNSHEVHSALTISMKTDLTEVGYKARKHTEDTANPDSYCEKLVEIYSKTIPS